MWPMTAAPPQGQAHAVRKSAPIRVLVVEDHESLRRSTMAMLKEAGFETEGALSGESALTLYATASRDGTPFDVVLLDRMLGGSMDGVETMRMLKAMDPEARGIMVSGRPYDDPSDADARHGFTATLEKPVPLAELRRAIESAVNVRA